MKILLTLGFLFTASNYCYADETSTPQISPIKKYENHINLYAFGEDAEEEVGAFYSFTEDDDSGLEEDEGFYSFTEDDDGKIEEDLDFYSFTEKGALIFAHMSHEDFWGRR